jgi:hypothetical protein
VEVPIGLVQVDDFSTDELRDAASRLSGEVGGRLQRARALLGRDDLSTIAIGEVPAVDVSEGVASPATLASLRHPVLWGEFAALGGLAQMQVLDDNLAGSNALAERFVERFCRKSHRRRDSLRVDRLLRTLFRIGRAFPPRHVLAQRSAHWIVPARGLITDDEAAYLFDEAVSYGVIREEEPGRWTWRHGEAVSYGLIWEEESGGWTWRHDFVGNYLRSQEEQP